MREEFDLKKASIYLNAGTHSICPRQVRDAVAAYQREYEDNPTARLMAVWPRVWKVQKELAAFFQASPQDLFLRPNVTAALNDFIQGLSLPKGGEIAHSELEYGAIVNACRFRAQRDGRGLRELELPKEPLTARALVQALVSQLKPKTSLLVVSHVMTGTGLVTPLAELAAETRRRGVFLLVDGAHAAGALPLSFKELDDVDAYAGNLHKWMLGPKGTGFGWLAPRHQERLSPLTAGWATYSRPEYFGEFGGGSSFAERMAMQGCIDFSPFLAIHETLEFWRRLGAENIRNRIHWLQFSAELEMKRRGAWRVLSPPDGPLRGPLLTFELPERLQKRAHGLQLRLWRDHALQVSLPLVRGRLVLRLSPHIHNSDEDIERGAQILADCA